VVTPRADDLLQVIGFQEKFGLSFYDASIIQSALAGQCSVLYSEGLTSGQSYAGVKIVNPFLEAASGKDGD
jgi:predicted nucleic acid-binding protein